MRCKNVSCEEYGYYKSNNFVAFTLRNIDVWIYFNPIETIILCDGKQYYRFQFILEIDKSNPEATINRVIKLQAFL